MGRRLGLETSPVGISERVAEANEHAFWEYEPEPYEGALAVIRSRREPLFAEEDASLGWEGLSAASLSLHEIDAYRDLMLEPPWVDDLARVVDEILDGHAGDEGQSSQSGDGSPLLRRNSGLKSFDW